MPIIIQANLQRSPLAQNLLDQIAREHDADLLIVSEQHHDLQGQGWHSDLLHTAAIWIRNALKHPVESTGSEAEFVWVKTGNTTYISVYLTPSDKIADLEHHDSRGTAVVEMAARLDLMIPNQGNVPTLRRTGKRGTVIDLPCHLRNHAESQ